MATHDVFVFAHLPQGWAPAGRLSITQEREVLASRFAYGTRYIERPDAFEIDPVSLSLADKPRVRGAELFPVNQLTQFGGIRDAAPDAWGRRVIEAQRRVPANSLTEADYLLGAGSDRVGALDVRASLNDPAQAGATPIQSLPYLMDTAGRIELGLPIPSTLVDFFGSAPGAGGARPKASVRDETGLLWLAKFPAVGDSFDVAWAECCTLTLARLCGLTVPQVKVQDIGGKSVLLIRRFDRYWHTSGTPLPVDTALHDSLPALGLVEQRLPFVSGLTLVACDEFESRLKSYADLAQAVREHVHPSLIRSNTEELFARMVFNIFVSNDDDHLRNHGFVRDPRLPGWRLSPLYDVVPRPSVALERQLHLQVGSLGKLATLDNAMSAYSAFTPQRSTAIAIIRRVWGQLRQWRTAFEDMGATNPGVGRLIDQLAPAMRSLGDIATPALQAEIRKTTT
ncbi:type II toxin-antitoxin system HipA family toxin [Rhodoferax fermentans]|uniref:Phosphatidylinositol kinase n=1 Tax=Rhodoferax fermentans TaxID=28066 RepID=A0A1T1AW12_RHOFE|nr:HipA domain-containing protein [Rhodoferax fermentans]MBK1685878.1 type II toxin-antitoxin system HipA family toxin [Rhodoferax fermentans]OOV08271.1 phosphatidylinositol kinase [Rhodoferax fermentans]